MKVEQINYIWIESEQPKIIQYLLVMLDLLHLFLASSIGKQCFGARNKGDNRIRLGASSTEYLRHVAVSRIFFDNIIHIQASWPTMGLEIAQLALTGGADDAGSTMMEENVVSASGTSKTMASEIELQKIILRSGYTPRKERFRLCS